ncbi:NinE family protein [Photorhabdus hindustanensis]|uniref:NinE family protein n=1 Tax=Photorhabdus hindustanensis TaxID=2918802 RepID=A0A2S8PTX9_9GAMM|nr:NinE family protein [Photorhabdus hindustanensis]PQQ22237.1 NinE family protein [Photorhabdus hindustanensis]
MSQQTSQTQRVINNLIYKVPSNKKSKPVPAESEVKTFDYVHELLKSKWDRRRNRNEKTSNKRVQGVS